MDKLPLPPVRVVLVGIGGYGHCYLEELLEVAASEKCRLVAAVEPYPENTRLGLTLKQSGIPLFDRLEDVFAAAIPADLVVIASPIHWHVPQSLTALEHGCHVLCDKPLGAVVQEADRLISAQQNTGLRVWIGYQWSFSESVQALKAEIRSGRLGTPKTFKTLCFWPRDLAYFKRNAWAGRLRDPDGRWVLDSPANNAMAHFLHNMLYLLGEEVDQSAQPAEVTAEAYRAFPIQNYDSVACRILTARGVELLFYASHAVPAAQGPMFHLTCEEADVACADTGASIVCRSSRGREFDLGAPDGGHQFQKLFDALNAVAEAKSAGQGRMGSEGQPVLCGPEAARSQTVCINGIQESVGEVTDLTNSQGRTESDGRIWIEGLSEAFSEAYERGVLPSETGLSWTKRGKCVDVRDYRYYPGGIPPEERES
jgi:predicted dehydrogenase